MFDLASYLREGAAERRRETPLTAAQLYARARFRGYSPDSGTELLMSVSSLARSGAVAIVGVVDSVVEEFGIQSPDDPQLRSLLEERLTVKRSSRCSAVMNQPNHAMQLTASKSAIYAGGACHRGRMLRGMHIGLAAADLVSR